MFAKVLMDNITDLKPIKADIEEAEATTMAVEGRDSITIN